MTSRGTSVAAALAVGGAVVALVRQLQRRVAAGASKDAEARSRWRAVTINRSPSDVLVEDHLPGPLAELGDLVEVEVRPAPGGKGSELRARLRTPEPSRAASAAVRISCHDPRQRVRAALREAKQRS